MAVDWEHTLAPHGVTRIQGTHQWFLAWAGNIHFKGTVDDEILLPSPHARFYQSLARFHVPEFDSVHEPVGNGFGKISKEFVMPD